MAVEIPSTERTRHVTGAVLIDRWIEANAGTDQIDADLDTLDARTDSLSTGSLWYGAPSPGEFDPGSTIENWYGREIRVPFRSVQAPSGWRALKATLKSFVEGSFPGELIFGPNRRIDFPAGSGDVSAPAKCLAWEVEFD